MAEHQIDTVIHCIEQLEMLEATKLPYPLKVWMKLDTGMHRLGVLPKDAEDFYQRLQRCQQVQLPINIVSHFCQADAPHLPTTENKLPVLNSLLLVKRGEIHCGLRGILLWPEAHYDWVRPGS